MVMVAKAHGGSEISGYGQSETGKKRKGSRASNETSVSEIRPGFHQSKGAGGKLYSEQEAQKRHGSAI